MHEESKLLKTLTKMTTHLIVMAAFISFTEPVSAGYIREGMDPNGGAPRRLIQVALGITNGIPNHPAGAGIHFGPAVALGDENAVRIHMRTLNPPISNLTHIEFWRSNNDPGTYANHTLRAVFGAAGAEANAYNYAITTTPHAQPIVPAIVTFSLHEKAD